MGVLDNKKEKIKLLEKIILNHNKSTYYDDALFLIAEHKKNSNMYSDALSFYDSVLVNTSEFNLKAKSHLGRAMIFFNNDDIEKAISEYKLIVDKFQSGTYFKEALLGLKSIYVGIAKVDEYISFINTIPNYRISESEQDSLSYSAAFIKFSEPNTSAPELLASLTFPSSHNTATFIFFPFPWGKFTTVLKLISSFFCFKFNLRQSCSC